MKFGWSNTRALLAGLALIVISNAIALGGVAYNRSGEPESILKLTERELMVRNWSWPDNDNSAIELQLAWRVRQADSLSEDLEAPGYWDRQLDWLNEDQLRALGFDVSGDVESDDEIQHHRRKLPREVFLVLEYEGAAYQAVLEHSRKRLQRAAELVSTNAGQKEFRDRLESAGEEVKREEQFASRLFVVDAGLDPHELRVRYPERERYAVVRGRLQLMVAGAPGKHYLTAHVTEINIEVIRVPHVYRALVEPLIDRDLYRVAPRAPRFRATVNFGRRFEPWILELART